MSQPRGAWLVCALLAGLSIGLAVSYFSPQSPVLAVATHGTENFAMCTASLDGDVEGVCVLDSLTGDLKLAVISPFGGKFTSLFETNVAKDFSAKGAAANKNAKYLLVSGNSDMRPVAGGGNLQPARSVIYVAELTTGIVNSYGMAWSPAVQQAGQKQGGAFVHLDTWQFRQVAIRNAGTK